MKNPAMRRGFVRFDQKGLFVHNAEDVQDMDEQRDE